MTRQIVTLKQLVARKDYPFSEHATRKLMKHDKHPLPHKRVGKRGKILFDLEQVWQWFDSLPGKD